MTFYPPAQGYAVIDADGAARGAEEYLYIIGFIYLYADQCEAVLFHVGGCDLFYGAFLNHADVSFT